MTKRRDTTRTLGVDGGGGKIVFSVRWLKLFVNLWGIPPAEIYKYFDVICGTSAGGIVALGLAYGLSIDEIEEFILENLKWVFTIRSAVDVVLGSDDASFPSNRPYFVQKLHIWSQNDQSYRAVSEASNYGHARLRQALTSIFGNSTLQNLQTAVIVPAYNLTKKKSVLFSNLNYSQLIGQNESIVNVALATAAAPTYLPPVQFPAGVMPFIAPTDQIIDGGLYRNNPSPIGLVYSKVIRKSPPRDWLCSVGTGMENPEPFEENDPNEPPPDPLPFQNVLESILTYFNAAIESSSDDLFLQVASTLLPRSSLKGNLFSGLFYHRAQPDLVTTLNTDLDNSDANFVTYLQTLAQELINNDSNALSTFIAQA